MIVEVIDEKFFQVWMTEKEDYVFIHEISKEMELNWKFYKSGIRKKRKGGKK